MAIRARRRTARITGIEELQELFQTMEDVAMDILDEAVKEAGEIVLQSAKQKCPVDTGDLKNSLEIRKMKVKKKGRRMYKILSKYKKGGVGYSFAVENGTSTIPAQPFIRPAYDENERNVINKINEKISEGLDRVI